MPPPHSDHAAERFVVALIQNAVDPPPSYPHVDEASAVAEDGAANELSCKLGASILRLRETFEDIIRQIASAVKDEDFGQVNLSPRLCTLKSEA